MARARNIKPAFFSNELLAELPAFDRLLFVGLWCLADREGRIDDRPKRIKMELFPCDSYDVDAGLNALCEAGFVSRYQVEGFSVIAIEKFHKHQSPHGSEKDSNLPDKDGYLTVNERAKGVVVTGKSTKVHVNPTLVNVNPPLTNALIPDSLIPDSLIPDSLNGQKHLVTGVTDFESFWKFYPRKVSKSEALKAWNKINPDQQLITSICAGLAKYLGSADWAKDDGQFIPHASTWLNQARWNDSPKPASNVVKLNRHGGFDQADYSDGLQVREDGTHAF